MAEAATAPAAAEKPAATLPNFEELAHGRVPLATGPSVADTWSDVSDGVPRPDRTLGGLRWHAWLGFLGLDHFYLRNPTTGILKLITFGGFLMWWLWDLMQVYTEGSRVIKYGISTPFDIATGIGQGMIVNDIGKDGIPIKTAYTSKSSFTLWQLGSLFSFVGLDSFITKDWARGSRKLMEFIMFIAAGKMVVDNYNGVSGHGIFSVSNLMSTMVVFFFGSIVMTNWTLALSNLFSPPETLLSEGIQVDPEVNSMLNSYSSLLDKLTFIDSKTRDRVKADLNYGSVSPEVMKKKFKIGHKDDIEREKKEEAAAAAVATGSNWLQSLLIWMLLLLGLVVQIGVYLWHAVKFGIKSFFEGPVAATMDEMQADAAEKLRNNESLMAFMENKVKGQMGLPIGASFIPGQVLGPPGTVIAQPQVSAPTSWNPFARVVHQGQILSPPPIVGGIPISSVPSAPPESPVLSEKQIKKESALIDEVVARVGAVMAEEDSKRRAREEERKRTAAAKEAATALLAAAPKVKQEGGARRESSGLSTDAMVLGAVVVALIGGGALKALIDNIISE